MKKSLIRQSCCAIVLLFGLQQLSAQKLVYVNSQAILAELPAVKQAESKLELMQNMFQKQQQKEMDLLQRDYENISDLVAHGKLSPLQQEEEASKLKDRETEIAKNERARVLQLQQKRNELYEPIYKSVNAAIQAVSKEKGFEMILDIGVLLYAEDYLDISALVRAKLGI